MRHLKLLALVAATAVLGSCLEVLFPNPNTGVLVGAGDIADCKPTSGDEATAALLDSIPGVVFTAGDNAYRNGSADDFANCYEPTWGRHKWRTYPVVGNHEYKTPGASAYFDYFGERAGDPSKGYYSYDVAEWHIVVLNSNNAAEHGLSAESWAEQERWLRDDLAQNQTPCLAAYWHHPLFSSGVWHVQWMQGIWDILYAAGADIAITGHEHFYERFAPQTSDGTADPEHGLREFVVGTGGRDFPHEFEAPHPNSEVRRSHLYGVLKLTLHEASYEWEFISVAGQTFSDTGEQGCHGQPRGKQGG